MNHVEKSPHFNIKKPKELNFPRPQTRYKLTSLIMGLAALRLGTWSMKSLIQYYLLVFTNYKL